MGKVDYTKWTFWATIIILGLTIWIIIISIPSTKLSIFYDKDSSKNFFTITNLGNKPATDVKISYSLDCQDVFYNLSFISADVPILTESNGANPSYKHFFDNRTFEIYNYYSINRDLCGPFKEKVLHIPYSGRINNLENIEEVMSDLSETKIQKINITRLICEECELKIVARANEDEIIFRYSFLNPIELNQTIFCVGSPVGPQCIFEMTIPGPSDLTFREDQDFYVPLSDDYNGVDLAYNSWREPIKLVEENRIII